MKEVKSPEELRKLLNSDDSLVIFYFLNTCPHCQVMHKPFEELEKEEKGKRKFAKVESENIPEELRRRRLRTRRLLRRTRKVTH